NKLTYPHPKRNFVPTTIATKSGQVPVNAAKQRSLRAATSISTARPVNTAAHKLKVNDALPITYSYFKAHSPGNPQYTLQDQGIFDSGFSRHMTGNKSFLIDYQEIDGGFVTFGGSPKGGKITGKGKIRTGKLDIEDSQSQRCNCYDAGKKTTKEPANKDERNGHEKEGGASNKEEKDLYGLHQAPRAWYETLSTYLLDNRFRRGTIDKTLFIKKDKDDAQEVPDEFYRGKLTFFLGLQVMQRSDGIFISQDKYVADILKKFDFSLVKTASTPIETNKALLKDAEAENVDVHLYRSMIGSLMYLTASRPDIMFAVCACARFQVTPKVSHLHAVKRIFRYLKGQPKLGLWYPRDSPFDLEAFSNSDYAGASLDRKSTTGGCQFLGKRLISWQCKKQTIVANSTTKAEYVAATNCCGQVLWIQNQMLDYGFNFMNTKIYIDNESTICIVIKIHTDQNVADLLTKAIDVGRFQYLIATNDEIQVSTVGLPYCWYALTTNPTIYVSLIEKFWQTTTVKIVDNGEQEITATVDGKEFTVTEASVRRHLQLEDVEAAEGEVSGHPSEPQPPPSTAQPTNEEPIPTVVSSSHQKTQTPRQALKEVIEVGRATTTAASLDAAQASGNITKTQPTTIPNVPISQEISTGGCPRCQEAMGGFIAQTRSEKVPTQSYDSPLPRVNTLGSDEGSMTLQELKVLFTTISKKVESLEADLQQTKKVYGTAYTKLIKKVKKLEETVKSNQARRRAKIVVSDDEEDSKDSSKQGRKIDEIDQDPDITLIQHDTEIQGRHGQEMEFETKVYTAEDVSTACVAVTTAGASISTASPPRVSTTEDISTAETLMYIRRSAAKDKAAVRLQEQLNKEERKRIANVHEEANSFNIEEWEDIQATIEADEELAQRIQAEEREKYSEAEKARLLAELINQRKRYFSQQRAEERRKKPLTQA
ncbi:putative ribonuclease H-like domain-containing protein, partial [Tanacetum coccineum]